MRVQIQHASLWIERGRVDFVDGVGYDGAAAGVFVFGELVFRTHHLVR